MSDQPFRVRFVEDGVVTVPRFNWPTTPQVRRKLELSAGDKRAMRVCATVLDVRERRG